MKTLLLLLTLSLSTLHAEELWKGTLHLAGGRTMKGVIEGYADSKIKFISGGDLYWFKLADLPAATRYEIGFGNDADKAAYLADLPRRQALVDAERAKARAEFERQRDAREAERRAIAYAQEQRDAREAERRAFQQRQNAQRQTEAMEQIALELQLRRLQGK